MNRETKKVFYWLVNLLVQILVGIVTGLFVAWLAFNYFKSNILSTVTDSIDIMNIDGAISALSDVTNYSPNTDKLAPVKQSAPMMMEIQKVRKSLEQAGINGEATLKELVNLLEAYEHLPIENTPIKFPGMYEAKPPKSHYRAMLQSYVKRVNEITNSISDVQGNITAVELAAVAFEQSRQQREDELRAIALNWVEQIKRRVESAKLALEERKSTLIKALKKYVPN